MSPHQPAERIPCQVLLDDRLIVDRVYLVDCRPIGRLLFELNDPFVIAASRVVDLWPSAKRIPVEVVREIASFGERAMGARVVFELVMKSGSTLEVYPDHEPATGRCDEVANIDFPDLPSPFTASDVVAARAGLTGGLRINHVPAYVVQVLEID